MSKGRHRSRLAGLVLAALTPVAALSVLLVSPDVVAAPEAKPAKAKAKCNVYAVDALKKEGGIPKELEFLKEQLEDDEFAAYKSFALSEHLTLELEKNKKGELTFKSGNKLGLTLIGNDEGRIKLDLQLTARDGEGSLLTTKFTMPENGVLLVGAGKTEDGRRFIGIQCAWAG